jgi:hypothetical protein
VSNFDNGRIEVYELRAQENGTSAVISGLGGRTGQQEQIDIELAESLVGSLTRRELAAE